MEHPFINDLSDKNMDEIQNKISELNTKLGFAYRTENRALIHQITMALESYRSAYNKQMDEMMKKQQLKSTINVQKK
jgi:hypothetical protein